MCDNKLRLTRELQARLATYAGFLLIQSEETIPLGFSRVLIHWIYWAAVPSAGMTSHY